MAAEADTSKREKTSDSPPPPEPKRHREDAQFPDPLSPHTMSNQATIIIGVIGHAGHGKSAIVEAITGVKTAKLAKEVEKKMTIKLGYANAKIYKCSENCYSARGSGIEGIPICEVHSSEMKVIRHVSFIDCPGHNMLLPMMMNGATIMDGALLVIAGNEICPQPQTCEHIAAAELKRVKRIVVLQNKIDLVKSCERVNQCKAIRKATKGTIAQDAPIIPTCIFWKKNIANVLEHIVENFPVPERDLTSDARMIVARSLALAKPCSNTDKDDVEVAFVIGSILMGKLSAGEYIECRPGRFFYSKDGALECEPLYSKIISITSDGKEIGFAIPGGLIGLEIDIEPKLTRHDRFVGHVLGKPGTLPDVFVALELNVQYLKRVFCLKTGDNTVKSKVPRLTRDEVLMVTIGSRSIGAKVLGSKNNLTKLVLLSPVCTSIGENVAICRKVESWRLVARGRVLSGATLKMPPTPSNI